MTTSLLNQHFPKNKYAQEICIIDQLQTNYVTVIEKNFDTFQIHSIRILSECKLINFISMKIQIGDNDIWDIPFDLLIKLSKIYTIGKYTFIELDPYLLCKNENDIPLLLITNANINIFLYNKYIVPYALILNTKYLYESECIKRYTINNNVLRIFRITNNFRKISFSDVDRVCIRTHNVRRITGFFITTSSLKYIRISVGHLNLVTYDLYSTGIIGDLINTELSNESSDALYDSLAGILPNELICHIEQYLLNTYWIPITTFNKWNSKKLKSNYDFTKYDIEIIFDIPKSGHIYTMEHDLLIFSNGTALFENV